MFNDRDAEVVDTLYIVNLLSVSLLFSGSYSLKPHKITCMDLDIIPFFGDFNNVHNLCRAVYDVSINRLPSTSQEILEFF